MRRSFWARVPTLGALLFMVGMFAGCVDPIENCGVVKSCGGKTLSSCATYDGCRFKSNDGHSWSCKSTTSSDDYSTSCTSTSCNTAAQEAADWCFLQSTLPTPTVEGQALVTELMHNPDVVDDALGEWFEIYNPGDGLFDLQGCEIRDNQNAHPIASHFFVPPRAFRTAAIFSTGGGFAPDYTYSGITFDNDAADEVSIWCGSTLIDRFAYSSSQASTSGHAFNWDPAGYNTRPVRKDVPQYVCPAKTPYNPSNAGSATVRDYGTPGATNTLCP